LSAQLISEFNKKIAKYINEIISSLLPKENYAKAFLLEKIAFPLKGTFYLKGRCF
jgi:hypothetical protein